MQKVDQLGIVAVRLGPLSLDIAENILDPVDGGQDRRHGCLCGRCAVAKVAKQIFGGMCDSLQPVEAEKARRALDGVNEPENSRHERCVGRVPLELQELRLNPFEMLERFSQEFA